MSHQQPDSPGPYDQPSPPDPETEAMDLPGWAPVTDPPGPGNPDPLPPSAPGAADPGGEYGSPGPGPSTPGSTRARALTARTVNAVSARGIGDAFSAVFQGLGASLNHLTALDDDDEVWLMSDEEAAGMGRPVGRILARRIPEDLGAGDASDLADGISAAIPAAAYLVKNLAAWLPRLRKGRKVARAQVLAPDLATEGAAA